MQEHPQYKITPEMGWSQMQPILDKAMPVERRSRRFIVFWWLAAAMIITISSFILLRENSQPADIQPVPLPSKEMATNESADQSTPASSAAVNQNNIPDNLNESKSANLNTVETSLTRSSSTHSTKSTADQNATARKQHVDSGAAMQTKNASIALDQKEKSESSSSSVSEVNEIKIATESELVNYRNLSSPVNFLPLAEVSGYSKAPDQIDPAEPGKNTPRNRKFIPNISMAGLIGTQNGLGFNAALGTDYVVNSRFSLTAGAGYRTYHPDVLNWGKAADYQLNEASYALLKDNYIDGEQLNALADYNAINPFVHSIHQWQITAGVKYKITHRFFLESGVALGFKTTALSEYPIADNPLISTPSFSNERSLNSYDIVRSNMTSIYLGGGYRVSRRFDVFSQWVHGLDQYLLNDQKTLSSTQSKRSDYIRGLQVGLKYNL